jgi:hypothetical protein
MEAAKSDWTHTAFKFLKMQQIEQLLIGFALASPQQTSVAILVVLVRA